MISSCLIECILQPFGNIKSADLASDQADTESREFWQKVYSSVRGDIVDRLKTKVRPHPSVNIPDAADFVIDAIYTGMSPYSDVYKAIEKLPVPPANKTKWASTISNISDPWLRHMMALYLVKNPESSVDEAINTYSKLLGIDKSHIFADLDTLDNLIDDRRAFAVLNYLGEGSFDFEEELKAKEAPTENVSAKRRGLSYYVSKYWRPALGLAFILSLGIAKAIARNEARARSQGPPAPSRQDIMRDYYEKNKDKFDKFRRIQ